MPPTRLQLAKAKLNAFFDQARKAAFSRQELNVLLAQNRTAWNLARSTTVNDFIDFLVRETKLKEVTLKSKHYVLPARFTWGDVSPYRLALSLKKSGYLSHATALHLHALAVQPSNTIYVNFEQSPKNRSGQLSQEAIDRAFASRQRRTNYLFSYHGSEIAILSGKQTGRLGAVQIQTPEGDTVDATNIERTLIDTTVRPDYAGGVHQVLDAYRLARAAMSVDNLLTILKRLNYIYPYHQAIGALLLPEDVALAAARTTGIVNVYGPWRNSSRAWCAHNAPDLRKIIRRAKTLEANDQGRLAMAVKVDDLPKISSPSSRSNARPGNVVTPVVACLDPQSRFPIVNGRKAVQGLLARLGLKSRNLEEQVRGMTGLIGRFGIADSFTLDVLADKVKSVASVLNVPIKMRRVVAPTAGSAIPDFDDSEREYLRKAATVRYRHRHNKMTKKLKQLLHGFTVTQGTKPDCRWDALIEHYERTGRDLLLELKPDPEKAAIRIAIGQLLDYRRFVPRPAATDIAVLTIKSPEKLYRQLLLDQQISSIWFTGEESGTLKGEGAAWNALRESLDSLTKT